MITLRFVFLDISIWHQKMIIFMLLDIALKLRHFDPLLFKYEYKNILKIVD